MDEKSKRPMATEDLLNAITETRHIDEFLQEHEDEIRNIDLQTYLNELLIRARLTIPEIIVKASISRSLTYQIFNGQRSPNRNLLIRLALVMKLDVKETQRLLRIARKGELYPRIQRDAAIIYCIQNSYSMKDTNQLLEDLGEAILFKEE